MDIGDFVKIERKRRGLTQTQLAERSGVGLNFVYQLEKNKQTVQLDTTNQVLKSLGYEIGIVRKFDPWVEENTIS
ncbi:MAG: transcriptional regulator [Zetaproteobacteria bacterium]|nr:transcriptional regulator [Pseudobdellovibrionaceae bacterium]